MKIFPANTPFTQWLDIQKYEISLQGYFLIREVTATIKVLRENVYEEFDFDERVILNRNVIFIYTTGWSNDFSDK